jgi:hypothetical protein
MMNRRGDRNGHDRMRRRGGMGDVQLLVVARRLRVDGRTAAGTYHVGDRPRFEKSIGGIKARLTAPPFSAPPPPCRRSAAFAICGR